MGRAAWLAMVLGLATVAAVTGTGTATAGASASGRAVTARGPSLRLIITQKTVTVPKPKRGREFIDPGIWVSAVGSDLRLNVQRASYTKPVTVTQIIKTPWGTTQRRPLPASLLDGWNGLKNFFLLTIRNSQGKVVATQQLTFCPGAFDTERASPTSPPADPYPQQCSPFDPFPLGEVWGLTQGWAVNPSRTFCFFTCPRPRPIDLPLGKYRATETITAPYTKLFHIPAAAATATVNLKVVKASGGCPPPGCAATRRGTRAGALPQLPHVPTLANPPRAALPQLTALPSWGIRTTHTKAGLDVLSFGATVWVGGNSPLDVEGFRQGTSPTMKAYQYFWRNGKVIGRAPAGTMGFETGKGENEWHFEQFARYRLLTASKKLAVISHKVGFCIAPTDPVDLLIHGALWQPQFIGFGGACGSPSALWVQEYMPIGWGDTYVQSLAEQAFDITNVPNGTYFIEITANPMHKLFELSTAGNTSLRKIILGGTTGHRTVKVPAWHGIDPEP
jgi:hypothetical protein